MQFLAKKRTPSKASYLFWFFRFVLLIANRLGTSFILLIALVFFVFSYSPKSSTKLIGPPKASVVQRLGSNYDTDALACGCQHADICSTITPIGSFQAPADLAIDSSNDAELLREHRRQQIRDITASAWEAYVQNAWGSDELKPVSQAGIETFGGMGTTIVESLSTLYVMNLTEQYEKAREWVRTSLDFDKVTNFVSVHETTTRILGGLISAFQLTGDHIFMQKAEDLGERLKEAFESVNGIPYPRCHLGGEHKNITGLTEEEVSSLEDGYLCHGETTTQTEAAGISLELRALGFHSLRPSIRELRCKADRAVQAVIEAGPKLLEQFVTDELEDPTYDGKTEKSKRRKEESHLSSASSYYTYLLHAWHSAVSVIGGGPTVDTTSTFTKPARGFYEYLVKAWRQGGSCEPYLRYPLDASMHMLLKRVIHETPTHDLFLKTYDDYEEREEEVVVDQSMCYLPAVFHLAAQQKKVSDRRIDQWFDVATGITKSCVNMYDRFPGYLGGESARYTGGIWVTKGAYELQADLVEAIFYMSRSTGEEKYQEIAWRILQNIDLQCKVQTGGYTVLEEKTLDSIGKGDRMPSAFLGATLKFLYLTFSDASVLPLSEYVFNRAGHPLLVTPGLGSINNCHSDIL